MRYIHQKMYTFSLCRVCINSIYRYSIMIWIYCWISKHLRPFYGKYWREKESERYKYTRFLLQHLYNPKFSLTFSSWCKKWWGKSLHKIQLCEREKYYVSKMEVVYFCLALNLVVWRLLWFSSFNPKFIFIRPRACVYCTILRYYIDNDDDDLQVYSSRRLNFNWESFDD